MFRWLRRRRDPVEGSWDLSRHRCACCGLGVAEENVEDYSGGGEHPIVCGACVLIRTAEPIAPLSSDLAAVNYWARAQDATRERLWRELEAG